MRQREVDEHIDNDVAAAKARFAGKADMGLVSAAVKKALSA